MMIQTFIGCAFGVVIVFAQGSYSLRYYQNKSTAYTNVGEDNFRDIETITPSSPRERGLTSYSGSYQGDQNLCPSRTFCTGLNQCRLLTDLMERSCLLPGRLKELTCGYIKNELMVCCPSGGQNSPFRPGQYDQDQDHHESPGDSTPGQNQELNQGNCGKPQLNGWQNGYKGLGSQPWVVRIGYKNLNNAVIDYPCCGTLITPTAVLTAAHCVVAKSPGRSISVVLVGEYDTRTNPDCTNNFCAHPVQTIPISTVIVHPGYEKTIFRHDIALVMLKQPANFSLGAQPICLLPSPTVPLVGMQATLVGFGKLPEQDTVAPRQHELELPIVSLQVCSKIYNNVIPITSNHLCVGGEAKKDACSGFGGAPLVIVDPAQRNRYLQVGLVSFGSDKCGAAGVPSVYTSIQEYYTWIKTNLP